MLHRSLGVTFSIALGIAASACGSTPEDIIEEVSETQDAIQDGYTDDADKAVVGIFNAQIGGICSGSLLAPNVVLTARHCVSDIVDEVQGGIVCNTTKFSGAHLAQQLFVTTATEMGEDPSLYHRVREVVLLPTGDDFCGMDQSILILDDLIPETETKPLVPRVDVPLARGEQYYAIGYGATSDRNVGAGLRRRRDNLFIDCVANECPRGFVSATEWVGDTGICEGDSGGPSLDLQNRVIGVTSRGSLGCSNPVYGYVFGWAQWIKDTTLRAASLGGYEAPAWATGFPTDPSFTADVGAACQAPAECPANACLNGYCTRPCNEIAACPSGYACEGDPGFCVKLPEPVPPPAAEPKADEPKEDVDEGGSCSVRPGPDPTKPIPWLIGAGALGALATLRRRRRGRAPLA